MSSTPSSDPAPSVYDSSASSALLTGTGNGCVAPPDDVREMLKYYCAAGKDVVQLPVELERMQQQHGGDYVGSCSTPRSKLMPPPPPCCPPTVPPVCSDAVKLLAPPGQYYQTSPGGYGDYVMGYGGGYDMTGYQGPGYARMTSSSASPGVHGLSDVKPVMAASAASPSELYQWVREQQHYANAANAIGITSHQTITV